MTIFLERFESLIREMIREEVALVLKTRGSLFPDDPTTEVRSVPISDKLPDRLLNAAEVAEILGVTLARVYELARQRKDNGFPVIVLGERQYRFSRERISSWLEQR